jgi:hypothetical protein
MGDIVEAIQVARDELGAQVLSNSWGSLWDTDGPHATWDPYWALVEAELALCVEQSMLVLFSAGNGGRSFTASMPETISVGGVYRDAEGKLSASNYASSFDSTRFPGEHVPELCGLVGLRPRAVYLPLLLEHATGATFFPGPGQVIRVAPDGARTVVASGLTRPTSIIIGPDGAIYVSNRAISVGTGDVILLEP